MLTKDVLLNMKLHEIVEHSTDKNCQIHRVFGGWIYLWTWDDNDSESVFVPEALNIETKNRNF